MLPGPEPSSSIIEQLTAPYSVHYGEISILYTVKYSIYEQPLNLPCVVRD